MSVQQRLIDAVLAQVSGNQSEAARVLQLHQQVFNNYVRKTRTADDEAIAKMADFLGENVALAVAQHRAETAKSQRVRDAFNALARVACTVALLVPVAHHAIATQVPFFVRITGGLHIMFRHMLQRVMAFARDSSVKHYRNSHVTHFAPCLLA